MLTFFFSSSFLLVCVSLTTFISLITLGLFIFFFISGSLILSFCFKYILGNKICSPCLNCSSNMNFFPKLNNIFCYKILDSSFSTVLLKLLMFFSKKAKVSLYLLFFLYKEANTILLVNEGILLKNSSEHSSLN